MTLTTKILQQLIKIRYNVHITGLDKIPLNHPTLIFPSHIALIDPVIIYAFLSEKGEICPVVSERYYKKPILNSFFKKIGAISVTDLERNENNKLDSHILMKDIITNLKKGKKILLYPQGAMARQGFQSIIGKKSAYYTVEQAPKDTKIITINIKGLRGSRCSRARTGKSPSISKYIRKGIRFTVANLFFFVPKRDIYINIQDNSPKLKKAASLGINKFNQELEKIYNKQGEESLNYLSGLFRLNTTKNHKKPERIMGSISEIQKSSFNSNIEIPKDILDKISSIIKTIKPDFHGHLDINTNLILDCYFDSLDMAELKSCIQSQFEKASNPPLLDLKTVGDVAIMAMGKSANNDKLKECKRTFSSDKKLIYSQLKSIISPESNILTVMKKSFKEDLNKSFCYDQTFGVQSKKDFLIKSYLISNLIKKIPGEKIAIMLPSLSITSILITGCYLAKKIPVMLNRTLSKEAFEHCIKSQGIKTILTSKSFFDKIQRPWIKNYNMTFFEELLSNISSIQKISAAIQSKRFKIPNNIKTTAVILFTSGSETLPKAVELSHQNLLQDLLGAAGIVGIDKNDVEIGFLPPFHSFGFLLGIVLPLISGMRIAYTPDPNDSKTISEIIHQTKATFLASTPTFLKKLIGTTKEKQISSLRIAIVGAEICPKEIFAKFQKLAPKATILEGYGITECSPIIAVNPFKKNEKIKRGTVGKPISGEKIKILNPDSLEELPTNQEGMIFVSGSNIFSGYTDKELDSPFIEKNGKIRYKTGDLGFIDKDGYLSVSGRLKRFVKIAGEMISLPAIENTLSQKRKSKDGLENLAIEATEKSDGTVSLTLFTTETINIDDVNQYLHEKGSSNLIHINRIIQIDEIPMLGTGKIDHVSLKKLLEEITKK